MDRTALKMGTLIVSLVIAASAEEVVLSSGFRMHVDNHAIHGSIVQLQVGQGSIEIPSGAIVGFEKEEVSQKYVERTPIQARPTPQESIARPSVELNPAPVATTLGASASLPDKPIAPKHVRPKPSDYGHLNNRQARMHVGH